MKNLTSKSEKKFQKVMHEFGEGTLKSHNKPVTDKRQALAIAFSEARDVYPNYGIKRKGGGIELTIDEVDQALKSRKFFTEPNSKEAKIIEEATKKGYVLRTSHTQAEWTEKGIEALKEPTAVKGLFSIDEIEKFTGYTFGDDWNGWAVPYFEKEEADKVAKSFNGRYENDTYFFDDGYDGEEEYEKQTIETVDGPKEVYAIGAYNWTWSNDLMREGGITGDQAEALAKIYEKGTAKQLWEAWNPTNRTHFLIDHSGQFFELMGEDYGKSADAFMTLTYDTLPSEIRKELLIHHAMGMYAKGGGIGKYWNQAKKTTKAAFNKSKELAGKGYDKTKEGFNKAKAYTEEKIHNQKRNIAMDVLDETRGNADTKADSRTLRIASNLVQENYAGGGSTPSKLSPAKKKLQERINALKYAKTNAGEAAQKNIQKKLDDLQKQFDYNPSAKERAMDNKGKFAMDVPAQYSKAIYKKLWSMNVLPRVHKLNGTHSIVVNSKINLEKAHKVYSDILKEKKQPVPSLSKISRKL